MYCNSARGDGASIWWLIQWWQVCLAAIAAGGIVLSATFFHVFLFTEVFCERTLTHCSWDLNRAAEYIFQNFEDKEV